MKILLLGEFSGLHYNLKKGFKALGHEVLVVGKKDGFKNIDVDISLDSKFTGVLRKIDMLFKLIKNLSSMKDHDVVHIINPNFFVKFIGSFLLKFLKKNNGALYLCAAGDDVQYVSYGLSGGFRYWPYLEAHHIPFLDRFSVLNNERVLAAVDGVISVMYEYAISYRTSIYRDKWLKTIPLCLDCSEIKYRKNTFDEKIVVYHGLTRQEFKGSSFIKKAMEKLAKCYPKKVEIVIADKMPLAEYLSVLSRANIVIDQCRGYSYGMNALYAMAQGKVVFSGAEKECLTEFGISKIPIINILPDEEQIFKELELFVNQPSLIEEYGALSRRFVEEVHDPVRNARMYLNAFS